MASIKFTPFAVHLAFSTYPLGQSKEYIDNIEKIYETYKETMVKCEPYNSLEYTYLPRKYHLFGHYDILFLSIIESYRFALKVFNFSDNGYEPYRTIDYQIQTGTPLDFGEDGTDYGEFLLRNEYTYINICNLKINNSLLIGLGSTFFTPVVELMQDIIKNEFGKDVSFVILNTYNWADLTLILLGNDPSKLAEVVIRLRELKVKELIKIQQNIEQLIQGHSLFKKNSELLQHVFIDSQSILGIDFNKHQNNDYAFERKHFSGQIEWDVKPGHIASLLESLKIKEDIFKHSSFRNGKTDLVTTIKRQRTVLEESEQAGPAIITAEDRILRAIKSEEATLGAHIQKIKTVPLFDLKKVYINDDRSYHQNHSGWLSIYRITNIPEILVAANNLKLSRQLRMKIEKIFYNYNNSISDSISYIYFIDFKPFLEFFGNEIISESSRTVSLYNSAYNYNSIRELIDNDETYNVSSLEIKYEKIINAFEEAYMDRVLNNYNYEDINDFNIDFNVNNTKLISTNDTLVKLMGPLLFDYEKKMLVRQNELNTVSNIVSINYNVFHLFEPHLIFNTIVKEICNNFLVNLERDPNLSVKFKQQIEKLKVVRSQIQNECNSKREEGAYSDDIDRVFAQFDLLYFETDALKYFYTFNSNTELYVFWTWLYYIQNTSLHSSKGTFIMENLTKELIRVLFIVGTFDPKFLTLMECPCSEMQNFWFNNFTKLKEAIVKIIALSSFQELVKAIMKIYKDHTLYKDYILGQDSELNHSFFNEVFCEIANPLLFEKHVNNDWNKYNTYLTDHAYEQKFMYRWKHLEIFCKKYSRNFEEGYPIIYENEKGGISASLYFNCISYLTLNWYYTALDKKLVVLPRNKVTGAVLIEQIVNTKDLFAFVDPQGGLFIIGPENRKRALVFTHSVNHALWHLSMYHKISLFN